MGRTNMSLISTLFLVVCSVQLILGQRYVPAPGYERLYGNDAKEWPSKKVYEKTPRPTKWTPPNYGKDREWMKNWEKPTPKPTKYVETPKRQRRHDQPRLTSRGHPRNQMEEHMLRVERI